MKYRPGMFDLSDVETDAPEVVFSEPGELGFDFSDVAIPYDDLWAEEHVPPPGFSGSDS